MIITTCEDYHVMLCDNEKSNKETMPYWLQLAARLNERELATMPDNEPIL